MDNNRISTGDVTHEFRTNRMVTDSEWTSPDKERIHRIRNGHKTDTTGHERMK